MQNKRLIILVYILNRKKEKDEKKRRKERENRRERTKRGKEEKNKIKKRKKEFSSPDSGCNLTFLSFSLPPLAVLII